MPSITRFLAILIALVALSPHGYSQTPHKTLEGITSIGIDVKDINPGDEDNTATCGATKEDIRRAASFPITSSRLRIEEAAPVYIEIRSLVVPAGPGWCAASFRFSVITDQIAELDATNLEKVVRVELWANHGIVVAVVGVLGFRLRDTVERMVKDFVVDWTLDQQ